MISVFFGKGDFQLSKRLKIWQMVTDKNPKATITRVSIWKLSADLGADLGLVKITPSSSNAQYVSEMMAVSFFSFLKFIKSRKENMPTAEEIVYDGQADESGVVEVKYPMIGTMKCRTSKGA